MSTNLPAFKVSIEDKDLTAIVLPRLINLTLTLCRGDESDQLDVSLDESDGKLALPPRGAQIALALGWQSSCLVDMGKFTVDEVEHSGAPDTITLRTRSATESDAYTGMRAFWHDERYARRRSVVAGVPGNSKRLRTTFASETDARAVAVAEWQRILRGLATFEMSLALGNPAVLPLSPVTVTGFKPEIDATDWLSAKVTHSLGGSGFTTRVEFETKTEAVEAEREDEKDPDEGITGVVARWKDVAAKKKKTGQELAGARGTLKTLEHLYKSKQAAKRAARHAWSHIEEVRDIIHENSEENRSLNQQWTVQVAKPLKASSATGSLAGHFSPIA